MLRAVARVGTGPIQKRIIDVPAPAANTNVSLKVPGGKAWELQAVRATFVASAQAAALKNSRWVGTGFAAEARAIHEGEKPDALIHGQATREEARALAEDGADLDKDERVSMLEAFTFARAEVGRVYERDNRLLTEHAMLDDDGDGDPCKGRDEKDCDGGCNWSR